MILLYAMADRDEDLKIGVKSTAILFKSYDHVVITILTSATYFAICWNRKFLQFRSNLLFFANYYCLFDDLSSISDEKTAK